ncbi:hypothetical protein [Kitasatospora purpeofusca]|uniref:hypothetical protein n=1 Tax=Kitasatospora purpeofusca TaxID=67352 RepID=UPI0036D2C58A
MDHPNFPAELAARRMLPPDTVCVFAAGSLIQGWGNSMSDYDLYVVAREAWCPDGSVAHPVALTPDRFFSETLYVGNRVWEVRYWQAAQIDQLLEMTVWDGTLAGLPPADLLGHQESVLLQRLSHARAFSGAPWLAERVERNARSALRPMFVVKMLDFADGSVDDALGQLEAGDLHSAVLSARRGFHCAVDALLASHGEFGATPKWRARRFRAADPATLSFDRYWEVETMRSLDPGDPRSWVMDTVHLTKDIVLAVAVR